MRAILTWHSVDSSGSPISVSPAEFRGQLSWLATGAVRVVGLDDLLALSPEASAVALTFDDGFANFATEAAPLLQAHGFSATLFVVSGHVGRDNRWADRAAPGIPVLPLLDWDGLARLREAGVALGAHTRSHPRLTELDPDALETELELSAEEITRRVGSRPSAIAYPYGAVNAKVARAAARRYRLGCTTELRPLASWPDPHRLPRLDAWYLRDRRRLAGFGTPGFRAWAWARRQARRLRRH